MYATIFVMLCLVATSMSIGLKANTTEEICITEPASISCRILQTMQEMQALKAMFKENNKEMSAIKTMFQQSKNDSLETKALLLEILMFQRDQNGQTALHHMAKDGNAQLIERLLKQSPKLINAKDNSGTTALQLAIREKHWAVTKILLNYGATGNTSLHDAARNGQAELIEELLQNCPQLVNVKDDGGSTAFKLAMDKKHFLVTQILLKYNATAVGLSQPKTLSFQSYQNGQTALHQAVMTGNAKLVEELLQRSPELVNVKDNSGMSALQLAIDKKYLAVARVLLKFNATVVGLVINDEKWLKTTLFDAVKDGKLENLEVISQISPELINERDTYGTPTLYWAVGRGHMAIVEKLLELSPQLINQTTLFGNWNSLQNAALSGHLAIFIRLNELAPHLIQATDSAGRTVLHWAARNGQLPIVEKALEIYPQLINMKDRYARNDVSAGWTALHWAAWNGKLPVVKFLLIKGANAHERDSTNRSAYDVAVQRNQLEIAKVLEQA